METASVRALRSIQAHGQFIRTAQAIEVGIHPRTLYQLRDSGCLEQISRGVYRLVEGDPISDPDLFTVATRIPQGVVCLVSALAIYQITTQIPRAVEIALPRGSESPRLDYPPIAIHRFSAASFDAGIETHEVDGVPLRVYSPEKTIADCFKFRHQLGMDIVLEALVLYRQRKGANWGAILEYAQICRVRGAIKPYLEAMLYDR
ncbi:type IV toxin-antitoxin system AbiEi family antitoxin domain-containing protein [Chamaesiphon polymorphus]|uniref:Transcriptional regulator n=1 Tax=Chamaesiphon polymorphus CCALA 037 TaxID=2107692 RepID=A0A2T1GJD2_9CYAN|nr:type IV toxin-antitoxin system AbiEi family antitoxin domain-containing protein [Chamaesiphon polymorphus]PSB57892.1 transcriptional regulator [Chamaesiphon polymorphus CCALA 037]